MRDITDELSTDPNHRRKSPHWCSCIDVVVGAICSQQTRRKKGRGEKGLRCAHQWWGRYVMHGVMSKRRVSGQVLGRIPSIGLIGERSQLMCGRSKRL